MNCSGNLAENWRVFEEDFTDYAIATKLTGKDDVIQVATLKMLLGKECKQVLHRLELTEDQLKSMWTHCTTARVRNFLFHCILWIQLAMSQLNVNWTLGPRGCNVISYNDVCAIMQHGNPTLAPTTARLKLYDGTVMPVLGECTLCCECKGVKHSLNFKVIAGSQKPAIT